MPRFWTDFEKPLYEDAPLYITTAGKESQCKVNYPQGFNTYHLFLSVSGEGKLFREDGSITLSKGVLMIHDAYTPLEYGPIKTPWVTAWLTFDGAEARELISCPFGVYRVKDPKAIERAIDEIVALPENRRQSVGRKLLRELLLSLRDEVVSPALVPEKETHCPELEKMRRYIETHFSKKITLDDLCRVSGYGKTKINDLFQKHLGTTPTRYIMQFRHYQATEYLKTSPHLSIREVARRCGYSSVAYMDRFFGKSTPSKFRREFKKHTAK